MNPQLFVSDLNNRYFGGLLSKDFQGRLARLPIDRPDVHQFVERVFKFAVRARIRPTDISSLHGDILGSLLSRILPGAWEGRIPPITLAGRHRLIDEYIGNNPWSSENSFHRILDLGCGFPPHTSIELAERYPQVHITGMDPSLPHYLVYDREGNYATFDRKKEVQYFQPAVPTLENWNALLEDPGATKQRFGRILDELLAQGSFSENLTEGKDHLFVEPARQYESKNLKFELGSIGDPDKSPVDVIRCFNVMFYFDNDFRNQANTWFTGMLNEGGLLFIGANWALSTESRYYVYQKENGVLKLREFAFSIDCVAPLGLVTWYANYDEDIETGQLADLLGILRNDDTFLKSYYALCDHLREESGICPREVNGYFGDVDPALSPGELWMGAANMERKLADSRLIDSACEILQRSGLPARKNQVGHIGVSGESLMG